MAAENNNLSARRYEKQFRDMLTAVYKARSYFGDLFAGGLEALDGVQNNETAFYVKTSDIPVVVQEKYNTDPNVAFGSGTGNSSRFGERTEIIYADTPVPYTWSWSFHEGIDSFTVNNLPDAAVADRLELQAQAKTKLFNKHHASFIAASAGATTTLNSYEENDIQALFNSLSAYFVNIEASGQKVAKVNTSLFNALIDHKLVSTAKGSTVNINSNELPLFKGFAIEQLPDELFSVILGEGAGTYAAFVYITNIAKAFTGINTARAIEPPDMDGVALQGAGKAGEFILDDNKKAIVKVITSALNPNPITTIGGFKSASNGSPSVTFDEKDAVAPMTQSLNISNAFLKSDSVAEKDNKTAAGTRTNKAASGNKNKNTPNLQPNGEPKQEDIDSENETPSSDGTDSEPKPEDISGENKEVPPNDSKGEPKPEDKPSDKK